MATLSNTLQNSQVSTPDSDEDVVKKRAQAYAQTYGQGQNDTPERGISEWNLFTPGEDDAKERQVAADAAAFAKNKGIQTDLPAEKGLQDETLAYINGASALASAPASTILGAAAKPGIKSLRDRMPNAAQQAEEEATTQAFMKNGGEVGCTRMPSTSTAAEEEVPTLDYSKMNAPAKQNPNPPTMNYSNINKIQQKPEGPPVDYSKTSFKPTGFKWGGN